MKLKGRRWGERRGVFRVEGLEGNQIPPDNDRKKGVRNREESVLCDRLDESVTPPISHSTAND